MKLYLASASPRRRKILKNFGISFQIIKPDYHEKNHQHFLPSRLVMRHALGKALSAAGKIAHGRVLAADTLVYDRGRIIGKPKSIRHAVKILSSIQGHWHWVYTGVAVLDVEKGEIKRKKVFYERTGICLPKTSRQWILEAFKKINPLDKAGAYALQSKGVNKGYRVKGSLLNAVGLPVEKLRKERIL
jgi:septum formation protein